MAAGFQEQKARCMKLFATALDHEDRNSDLLAYVHYLKCTQHISALLSTSPDERVVVADYRDKLKLMDIAKKCLERSEELLKRIHQNYKKISPSQSLSASLGAEGSLHSPAELQATRSLDSATPVHSLAQTDKAKIHKERLMTIYQQQLKKRSLPKATPQKQISLARLRRLEEMVSIAAVKEQNIVKNARRLRKFKETQQSAVPLDIRTDIEALTVAMTTYENGKARFSKLRKNLQKLPVNPQTLVTIVTEALQEKDHPLYKEFGRVQFVLLQKLLSLVKCLDNNRFLPKLVFSKQPLAPQPASVQPSLGSSNSLSFTDKLSALRAELNNGGDPTEDELLADLGLEPENLEANPANIGVFLEPASPVATTDISPEDLKEVFGTRHLSLERSKSPSPSHSSSSADVPFKCQVVVSSAQSDLQSLQAKANEELPLIIRDLQSAIGSLMSCILSCYKIIDESGDLKDSLEPIVEENLFPPLWPHLLDAFRLKNYDKEVAMVTTMAQFYPCKPEDLQVKPKFCMKNLADSIPYMESVKELDKLMSLKCPTMKLVLLVSSSKQVFQSIEDYYSQYEEGPAPQQSGIGVDDILPIVCYVVMKLAKPQFISEIEILETFINESYTMGEDGFCLTTFHTAVEYIRTMNSTN